MIKRGGFLSAGHLPTLVASLLYFDVSFMAWVLFGPVAPFIHDALHLTATEQGLLTAIPLLGGSLCRPLLGIAADRIGGRRTGLIAMTLTLVPLVVAWKVANTLPRLYAVGFMLGIAGASFAVALPLASRWYPREYQGLAMGIAGAGNSGTLLATLFAPRIAEHFGWHAAFGVAVLPVAMVLMVFALLASDSPQRPAPASLREYTAVMGERDTIWLALMYGLTFGGFVGFSSFLPTFFHDQYQLSRVTAGDLATVVVIAGSLLRPVGGWVSDRLGGYRLLVIVLGMFTVCLGVVTMTLSITGAVVALFFGMGLLGMGNGAVFQLVPQRFPDRMGVVTGVVGAAGGLGGFFLPTLLGAARDLTGSYTAGLLVAILAFLAGMMALLELGAEWSRRWAPGAVQQAGIYSYRSALRSLAGERA